MAEIACYLLQPTTHARRGLRRYGSSTDFADLPTGIPPCAPPRQYHDATTWIDTIPSTIVPGRDGRVFWRDDRGDVADFLRDPRWPTTCTCGYRFDEQAVRQIFTAQLYQRTDTGEAVTLRDAPPGAIWDAFWMPERPEWRGPDGSSLLVRLPNGLDWHLDGIASNCDAPCQGCGRSLLEHRHQPPTIPCRLRTPRPHKCWVRHGQPPNLHVDKNGVTCGAGSGSILAGDYHGFLHHGKLVQQ